MKYKIGDIVTVNHKPKIINWNDTWTKEMDSYIGAKSKVINIDNDFIDLLLLDDFILYMKYNHMGNGLFALSYRFPISCISNFRKEKIIRLLQK